MAQLVVRMPAQAQGHRFEPVLKRYTFIAENIPVLSGRLVYLVI